jgi:hypothetical protein
MRYKLEFVEEYRDEENPKGAWCVYDTQDPNHGLESFSDKFYALHYMNTLNDMEWAESVQN